MSCQRNRRVVSEKMRYSRGPLIALLGPEWINDQEEATLGAEWVKKLAIDAGSGAALHFSCNVQGGSGMDQWYLTNGIVNTRAMMLQMVEHGVPLILEIKDQLSYIYFKDLVSCFIIDDPFYIAVASGASCPVGVRISLRDYHSQEISHWIEEIAKPHKHITMMDTGVVSIVETIGNGEVFLIIDEFDSETEKVLQDLQTPFMFNFMIINKSSYNQRVKLLRDILSSTISPLFIGFKLDTGQSYSSDIRQQQQSEDEPTMEVLSDITNGKASFFSKSFSFKDSYSRMSNKIKSGLKLDVKKVDETDVMECSADFVKFADRLANVNI